MKLLLYSSPQTSVIGPSTMFSVVAHVVLVGAAIYGTGVNAKRLEQAISQRVQYLPPPDRARRSTPSEEHLQYIDVGDPSATFGTEQPDGRAARFGGLDPAQRPRGAAGDHDLSQIASPRVDAADSVYSVLDVDEQAVRMEGSFAPAYPADLLKSGTTGRVYARYVIDTTGYADVSAVEIVSATHSGFARSVRDAIPLMRFRPAMVGGLRVRQSVEQSFEFRINPPDPAPAEHTRTKPVP